LQRYFLQKLLSVHINIIHIKFGSITFDFRYYAWLNVCNTNQLPNISKILCLWTYGNI
jgi:hypothetical protein